jgi:ATP-dependent DNA ligase
VQLCAHLDQPGDVVFAHACKLGYEGIVSKRLGSKYRRGPGKCSDCIKVKIRRPRRSGERRRRIGGVASRGW